MLGPPVPPPPPPHVADPAIDWHLGFFFSVQDFILEHYSEDSYLYEDDIADLMDLRQVRAAVWESALLAEASGHHMTDTSSPGESGMHAGHGEGLSGIHTVLLNQKTRGVRAAPGAGFQDS